MDGSSFIRNHWFDLPEFDSDGMCFTYRSRVEIEIIPGERYEFIDEGDGLGELRVTSDAMDHKYPV